MRLLLAIIVTFALLAVVRGSSESLDIENILIKPYEQVCDQEPGEDGPVGPQIDQTRAECPLPLNSSSRETGCLCHFDSSRIECIYADRLVKTPEFSRTVDGNLSESSIAWSVDLRCKNFSRLDGFEFVTNLTELNELDLAGLTLDEFTNRCKLADGLGPNQTLNFRYLEQIGYSNKTVNKSKFKVKLGSVNLASNRIHTVHIVSEPVHIRQLNLAHNQIEKLSIRANLDICTLKIDTLNISSNRIKLIELGYLIFLRVLNISHNQLGAFSVDFYDTREFFSYARNTCNLNYTTHGDVYEQQYVLDSNLVEIDFTDNLLSNLPFSFIKNVAFRKLEKLIAAANQIKSVGDHDLRNLDSLRHLSLRSNAIESIDEKSFVDLKQLKYLDLSVNYLHTIPNSLFTSQERTLETLLMTHNYLETIPRSAFRHLASLKYLNLNCNRIRAIQNYSFGFMSSLIEVSLAANMIESIEPEAFSIDQSSLLGPGLIEKLDLSGNRIVSLNQTVFYYLTNLRHLVLSNNKIKFIDRKVFRGIGFLITLDLSFNQLSSLDFLANRNFSLVRYLTMSNNRLRRLRPGQFVFLKSLSHLDLSANGISRIDDCAFSGLEPSIRRVYLNYNRIRRLNSCAFAIDFRQLRFVQILANPLNCSHNCEFFYVIYNPPYSINYEGFECANASTTNFSHCSAQDFDLVYKKCRAKMRGERNCSKLVADMRSAAVDEFGMVEKSSQPPSLSSTEESGEDYATAENIRLSLLDDEYEEADDDLPLNSARGLTHVLTGVKIFFFQFLIWRFVNF